jgi:D-sedoheptulose 7-phosphate isomerase
MRDMMNRNRALRLSVAEYLQRLARMLESVPEEPINETLELLFATRESSRRVYIFGNGGSASIASHLACDLAQARDKRTGVRLRTCALADNTALLTAWSNDTAFERVFAEEINDLAEAGDMVIAISPNGSAPNIIAGLRAAADRGAHAVALVGADPGETAGLAEIIIQVPSADNELLEEAHSAIAHALTVAMRQEEQ